MIGVYSHITSVAADRGNLGDRMGFLIADRVLGRENYRRLGIRQKPLVDATTLGIVGSLVAAICDTPGIIVGGGLINGSTRKYSPDVHFAGVRGFLTQALVARDGGHHAPVIGDPGLLISRLLPMPIRPRKPLGFIVHAVDRDEFADRYPNWQDCLVDNYASEGDFVEQLSGYEAVVSTSLHGCVFAHAYGIPVKPYVLTDEVFGGDFKFMDYYSSYGIQIRRAELSGHPDLLRAQVLEAPQPTAGQVVRSQRRQIEAILAGIEVARSRAMSRTDPIG